MKKSWTKLSNWLSLVFVLGLLMMVVVPVQAAEITDDGTVDENTVIDDDLVISAENVLIDGTVKGNVIAFGNRIEVNGTIEGDLFAMGQVVVIGKNAVIGGNLFAGAAEVTVKGLVEESVFGGAANFIFDDGASTDGNLYVGGFSLEIAEEAEIGRDAYFGGYQIDFSGTVADDLMVSAEAVDVSGVVGDNFQVEMDNPEPHDAMGYYSFSFPGMENPPRMLKGGLNIAESADIAGKLTVIAPVLMLPELAGAPAGGVALQTPVPSEDDADYSGTEEQDRHDGGFNIIWRWGRRNIGRFMALSILGALLLWLCRKPFEETVQIAVDRPWASLGYGALGVFGGYLAAFIAALVLLMAAVMIGLLSFGTLGSAVGTLGFSALAIVYTAFQLSVKYLSKLVIAFWLGRVILKAKADEAPGRVWLAALIGVSLYAVARALPILGWFIGVAVTFFGLGAIVLWCLNWWKNHQSKRQPQAAPAGDESFALEELPLEMDETPQEDQEYTLPE